MNKNTPKSPHIDADTWDADTQALQQVDDRWKKGNVVIEPVAIAPDDSDSD